MSTQSTEERIEKDRTTDLFIKFIFNIWFFVVFYTGFYYYIGAYFAFIVVAIGAFILSPITLYLVKIGKINIAKWLYLISCQVYVYGTSIGLGDSAHVEYFYPPTLLISLVFIEVEDTKSIVFFAVLPFVFWTASQVFGNSFIPPEWIYSGYNSKLFTNVNFVCAYALNVINFALFVSILREQRSSLVTTAKMSSLGEMASGIAHEINNPLYVILNKTKQIIRKIDKDTNEHEELVKDLNKIENTALRISKIVKGLKLFARNSDQDPYMKSSIKEIFEDTIELCIERINTKQIHFEYELDSNFYILAKPTLISQVFMNLINNSIDAIDGKQDPWIKINSSVDENNILSIYFIDSGKGISTQIRDKIMLPFFTTKEIGKGTGLGLSISKGIIEEHNGTFEYLNNCENTTFVIKIPIDKTP